MVGYTALALPVIGVGLLAHISSLRTAGLLLIALVALISTAVIALISLPSTGRPRPHTVVARPAAGGC